ncbi:MAG: biopolymer transporter ExbD [Cytophagales bacterium]|nr:MAG: biopolymer transporter ExbD [Cytophagales bacterium]
MAKIKMARKSSSLDMTAMVDVAFLLLTFFMLASQFKPKDVVSPIIPASVSQFKIPEKDIMIIALRNDGAVFFGIDGRPNRQKMLENIAKKYNMTFTPNEIVEFNKMENFGVPIAQLKSLLKMTAEGKSPVQNGIPTDSTNNQLGDWIYAARLANPKIRIAIKGDKQAGYSSAKEVVATLQQQNINRFNMITSLREIPKITN